MTQISTELQRVLTELGSNGSHEVFQRPAKTGCVDCGRQWLSDLNPIGRSCPRCGGEVDAWPLRGSVGGGMTSSQRAFLTICSVYVTAVAVLTFFAMRGIS